MNIEVCPIAGDVGKVVNLSGDLSKALRQLRRDLRRCEACPPTFEENSGISPGAGRMSDSCSLRSNFQSQVTAAITQVQEDWNLVPATTCVRPGYGS